MGRRKLNEGEKILTEDSGGILGKTIAELKGLPFICAMSNKCNTERQLDEFRGYRHEGGLPDKEGNKYWTYWNCPGCGHDWSYPNLSTRLRTNIKTLEEQIKSNYKILASEENNWFIAIKKGKDKPLYEGFLLEDAREAILFDMDIPFPPIEKRKDIDYNYEPTKEDFS